MDKEVKEILYNAENSLREQFRKTDETAEICTEKILKSMRNRRLSDAHFAETTGYGYNDIGRDTIEKIYADVFGAESALVRAQIISGTHALSTALFGNLRHGDELLYISGEPYDTLKGVIGITPTKNSLAEHGVTYRQAELLANGEFDREGIGALISEKTKVVGIQRSKGYSFRKSLFVSEIDEIVGYVKSIRKDIICMVDNCYGEFTDIIEPCADLVVGSLIKNAGGGLAPVGGYIAGNAECVANAADCLTAPGLGAEIGANMGVVKSFAQGLFVAPAVVAAALKGAMLTAKVFETLGYEVSPKPRENRADIVQAIKFGNRDALISFCKGIQEASPVDSFAEAEPAPMPGYVHDVIMAAGTFVSGASIELSADAPIREPYIAYVQGGLTFSHCKIGLASALCRLKKDGLYGRL
ncbi:hypothetical protein AGMMS49975_10610 [Clostridia bacterium]|nr:hypothetical protein AGMMS49975_10610 [Clostridia bacterium]